MYYFVADAISDRMFTLDPATNKMLGFSGTTPRGAELNDEALLYYLSRIGVNFQKILCKDLTEVAPNATYLVANFVMLSEEVKKKLISYGNYVIYEHDHKYSITRRPDLWIDNTNNLHKLKENEPLPKSNIINREFYASAEKVICLTDWHQAQIDRNVKCNSCNIHGTMFLPWDLELIDTLRTQRTNVKDRYVIFNNQMKGSNEALEMCRSRKLPYVLVSSMDDRKTFLTTLSKYKGLVFLPEIPETCSRLLVEAKMLGLDVVTNENSGASHEAWWLRDKEELTRIFRTKVIPDAVDLFKEFFHESKN